MNKDRRKEIAALASRVQEIAELIDSLKSDLENVRDEEQDYFDNMPENMQDGDRGTRAQDALNGLDDALSALDDFDGDTITGSLDTAAE